MMTAILRLFGLAGPPADEGAVAADEVRERVASLLADISAQNERFQQRGRRNGGRRPEPT